MEFQLSCFKSWKIMLWKCCTQYASKYGKLSSGHKIGKGQFHSNLKERQCQRMLNYRTIALISHASKVMLKILQARLQQYMNCELPDVKAGFRKGRRTRDQIANIRWIIKRGREFWKKKHEVKQVLLLYWLCQNLWLCGSQQNVENPSRGGNTRPPDLPLEKSVCRSRSNS